MEPTADILETLFMQRSCSGVGVLKKKRKELGKLLLRRYWPLTNVNDTNPNLVFRPRGKVRRALSPAEEEQSRTRRCWERLIELKANLEQGRTLCQLTHSASS
ncbi:hypothetical protein WA556_004724 [Blastocystis sp. ATCC 50177/Nand II]